MNHNELREKALKKPRVAQAYKELGPEYSLLKRMLLARKHAGLSQSDVAKRKTLVCKRNNAASEA
jgi:hypothetical protein